MAPIEVKLNLSSSKTCTRVIVSVRAVDPHSFFANPYPDPVVLLNADPDPAAILMWIRIPA